MVFLLGVTYIRNSHGCIYAILRVRICSTIKLAYEEMPDMENEELSD
jgi:hypothetical protein